MSDPGQDLGELNVMIIAALVEEQRHLDRLKGAQPTTNTDRLAFLAQPVESLVPHVPLENLHAHDVHRVFEAVECAPWLLGELAGSMCARDIVGACARYGIPVPLRITAEPMRRTLAQRPINLLEHERAATLVGSFDPFLGLLARSGHPCAGDAIGVVMTYRRDQRPLQGTCHRLWDFIGNNRFDLVRELSEVASSFRPDAHERHNAIYSLLQETAAQLGLWMAFRPTAEERTTLMAMIAAAA